MFKLLVSMRRKPGMSLDEFIRYYEEKHAPLARRILPPIGVYRRNYIRADDPLLASVGDGRASAASADFDVITEAIYPTRAHAEAGIQAFFDADIMQVIRADEDEFVEAGSVKMYVVEVHQSAIP
ncbi:EthD domain-containing protein [Sphingobium indicum]|nr:EthD domain-containing protein [Sphingobium indicum]